MSLLLLGMVAGLNAIRHFRKMQNKEKETEKIVFPENTMIGALSKYIQTPNENFQPMNANFGLIPELPERIKDKKVKYAKLADRAIEELNNKILQILL